MPSPSISLAPTAIVHTASSITSTPTNPASTPTITCYLRIVFISLDIGPEP